MEVDRAEPESISGVSRFDTEMMQDSDISEAEDGELVDDNEPVYPKSSQAKISFNSNVNIVSEEAIQRLYKSMGVDKNTRLEALHLFGTDGMKTQDIFEYFDEHTPASVEWITDKTCNVVWLDEKICASALLACSIKIKGQNIENGDHFDSGDEESINIEDLRMALPPGIWRKGHMRQYAPNLFLRFAYRNDKQNLIREFDEPFKHYDQGDEVIRKNSVESANPWSDIARQWGKFEYHQYGPRKRPVPMTDARNFIKKRDPPPVTVDAREVLSPDEEPEMEKPYGGMHADLEERKIKKKKNRRKLKRLNTETDLRQRLGRKRFKSTVSPMLKNSSSDEHEVKPEGDVRSRLGGITWTGYDSGESSHDSDEIEVRPSTVDLRQKLTKGTQPFVARSPLRIEIDNDMYRNNAEASDNSNSS